MRARGEGREARGESLRGESELRAGKARAAVNFFVVAALGREPPSSLPEDYRRSADRRYGLDRSRPLKRKELQLSPLPRHSAVSVARPTLVTSACWMTSSTPMT